MEQEYYISYYHELGSVPVEAIRAINADEFADLLADDYVNGWWKLDTITKTGYRTTAIMVAC